MANIVAANVSAQILEVFDSPAYASGTATSGNKRRVVCEVTIVTNTGMPAGGIPLDNLFTAGSGSDTGLDLKSPIRGICTPLKTTAIAAGTFAAECVFSNGGTTAATQTLLALVNNPAGTDNFAKVAADSQDLNAANFTLGTPPYKCFLTLYGNRRPGLIGNAT